MRQTGQIKRLRNLGGVTRSVPVVDIGLRYVEPDRQMALGAEGVRAPARSHVGARERLEEIGPARGECDIDDPIASGHVYRCGGALDLVRGQTGKRRFVAWFGATKRVRVGRPIGEDEHADLRARRGGLRAWVRARSRT